MTERSDSRVGGNLMASTEFGVAAPWDGVVVGVPTGATGQTSADRDETLTLVERFSRSGGLGVRLPWPGEAASTAMDPALPSIVRGRSVLVEIPGPVKRNGSSATLSSGVLGELSYADEGFSRLFLEAFAVDLAAIAQSCSTMHVSIGSEVETFLVRDPLRIDPFLLLLESIGREIKQLLPGALIGTSFAVTAFQTHRLRGVISRLSGALDWVGFTHFAAGRSPVIERPGQRRSGALPYDYTPDSGYIPDLVGLMEWLSGDLPFLIARTSLPTSASWGGSEHLQAAYLSELLEYVGRPQSLHGTLVLWDQLVDPTVAESQRLGLREYGGNSSAGQHSRLVAELIGTSGIISRDGAPKLSAQSMSSYLG